MAHEKTSAIELPCSAACRFSLRCWPVLAACLVLPCLGPRKRKTWTETGTGLPYCA